MKHALLFLLCLPTPGVAADLVDRHLSAKTREELRLRLEDPLQEARTTAVNWVDLGVRPPAEGPKPFRVVVDPGHGGEDDGAVGPPLVEKDTALFIARLVRRRLLTLSRGKDFPVEVRLTREDDRFIPLRERARFANEWDADLFVSIHLNSSPSPRVRGFEVYFMSPVGTDAEADRLATVENAGESAGVSSTVLSMISEVKTNRHVAESSGFAEAVYQAMAERLLPNKRGVRQAPFAVLAGTEMPALLIEAGYLTNEEDRENLQRPSYLKRVADAIGEGILLFALGRGRLG